MTRTVLGSENGFTLIELLLAAVILSILTGLSLQAYSLNKQKAQHAVAQQTMIQARTAMEAGKADITSETAALVMDQTTPGPATEGDGELIVPGLVVPDNARVYVFHNPACTMVGCMEDYILTRHCQVNQRVIYFKPYQMPGTLLINAADPSSC